MNLPDDPAERLNLLERLFETSAQGIWVLDEAGTTKAVNPAMCRMLGREARSLPGRSVYDLLHPEDAARMRRSLRDAGAAGQVAGQEAGREAGHEAAHEADTELARPDGTRCWCTWQATPLRDAAGAGAGWLVTWSDVTAQRQAENAVQMFGLAADASPDLISVVDETGHYRMVNDAWCRANRLSRKEVLGRHVKQVAADKLIPERRDALVECLIQRHPVSAKTRLELADRGVADLEIDYYPFGDDLHQTRHVMMICRDVTAREAVLQAARAADADKRALLEAFPGYIAAINQDLRYVYVNQATAARLGSTPEEVIGRRIDEVLEGDTLANMRRDIQEMFGNPGKPSTFERTYPPLGSLPAVTLQVTRVATPPSPRAEQTFYAFGVDVSDYQRARRDVDLLLGRAVDRSQTA